MSKVSLSERGEKSLMVLGFALFMGALFIDWLLIIVSIAGLGGVLYVYFEVRQQLGDVQKEVELSPGGFDFTFSAGDEFSEQVVVDSKMSVPLSFKFPYGALDNPVLYPGMRFRQFSFKPELAANYNYDEVEASLSSRYDLMTGVTEIPFGVEFNVYPRVFSASIDALSFLEGYGIQGAGEQVSQMKGRGYEYADSREYVPRDSLKMINWKASARLNRLIVKEYYMESSGAIHILYENMVSDPVSSDVLSACFLRTVQSFAEAGWVIGLSIIEDGVIRTHEVALHPDRAVASALRYVLGNKEHVFRSFYEILDPVYKPRIDVLMDGELPVGRFEMNQIKEELLRTSFGGVIYISALIDNPINLIEVADAARMSGTRMVALEPCSPWLYGGLEDAYRVMAHYEKMNRNLMRSGVGIAVSVEEAQAKMGELEVPVWT